MKNIHIKTGIALLVVCALCYKIRIPQNVSSDFINSEELANIDISNLEEYKKLYEPKEVVIVKDIVLTTAPPVEDSPITKFRLSSKPIDTDKAIKDINKELKGSPLQGLGTYIVDKGKEYDINPYFIVSVAVLESGKGTSQIGKSLNNLFGLAVYTNNGKGLKFRTKEECIDYFCNLIDNKYLNKGRTNVNSIGKMYAADPEWATKVQGIMKRIAEN